MNRARGMTVVGLGALGSVYVAAGALSARYVAPEFLGPGLWHDLAAWPHPTGQLLLLLGMALLAVAFGMFRDWAQGWDARLVAVAWYLPLLAVPPVLSRDMYSYADQGWMAAHVDPYVIGMGTAGPFATLVDDYWRGTTTVYPPLALEVERLIYLVGGEDVITTVLLMRVPVLVSLAVIAWLLPAVARRVTGGTADRQRVWWLALLNPMTVVHLVGGGHNDAVMIALMVVAMALATRRGGYVLGALAAGIAMAAKQPGLLAAVPVAMVAVPAKSWGRRFLAAAGAVALALLAFTLVSVASFGFGWLWGTGAPSSVDTQSPARLAALGVAAMTGTDPAFGYAVLLPASLVLLAVTLLLLWWRHRGRPLTFTTLGLLAFAALGPGLQPWYLAYALTFAAITPLSRRLWAVVAGWTAHLMVGQYLAETWGMLTLVTLAFSAPVGVVVALVSWHLGRGGARRPAAAVEGSLA